MPDAQWWCSRLCRFGLVACPNVPENRGDDVGVLDAGDDVQRQAALDVFQNARIAARPGQLQLTDPLSHVSI